MDFKKLHRRAKLKLPNLFRLHEERGGGKKEGRTKVWDSSVQLPPSCDSL